MTVRWLLCLVSLLCFSPNYAEAHVKWFVEYNLLCPPRSPSLIVFGEYFPAFCLAVAPIMFAVVYMDYYLIGTRAWLARTAAALTDNAQPYFPIALRFAVSAFFIAAASYGGFILTPELRTEARWITVLHLAIAGLALHRRTAFLAGIGVFVLYAHAVIEYGLYHLLDYPIFLGIATYIIIDSLAGEKRATTAHNIMRWCTGVTLLWAGIEKFAYPEWSFGLLHDQPSLTFGFGAEFYMVAAGFVEFCCAYLLIVGALYARASAAVLLFFFVSAIYYFGLIDAIGHSGIIAVLVILILSENPFASHFQRHGPAKIAAVHTTLFFGILFLFIWLYSDMHYLIYSPYPDVSSCST